jgi:hypothetical protein
MGRWPEAHQVVNLSLQGVALGWENQGPSADERTVHRKTLPVQYLDHGHR